MLSYAFWLTNYVFEPLPFQLDHSLRGVLVFALGAVLSLGIGRMLDGIRGRVDARIVAVVVIAAVIVATVVTAFFHMLVMYVIVPRWGAPMWTDVLEQIPMGWAFVAWVLLYFALVADAARRDREVRLAQATATAIDAQHRLLVQQINPHFLFNTLNTISSFVTSRPEQARDLITELAALLRDSIREADSEYCPLGHECELAERYLRIIGVRFGERFKPSVDVLDSLKTQSVPRGLLLTLIENAVTHGVSTLAGDCTLSVHCTSQNRFLVVEVRNDYRPGVPSASERRGGLAALDTRLRALYGDAYRLEYGGDDARLWCVRVVLPIADTEAERAPDDRAGRASHGSVPRHVTT
jgi:energy-coupling factor transporter transmembrane protein EcfT